MAPVVAKIMAKELRKNDKWEKIQCENYAKLVKNYTINQKFDFVYLSEPLYPFFNSKINQHYSCNKKHHNHY